MERVWMIYTNGSANYTVAKQPSGGFIMVVAGPFTWDEAAAWMRGQGVPGW